METHASSGHLDCVFLSIICIFGISPLQFTQYRSAESDIRPEGAFDHTSHVYVATFATASEPLSSKTLVTLSVSIPWDSPLVKEEFVSTLLEDKVKVAQRYL